MPRVLAVPLVAALLATSAASAASVPRAPTLSGCPVFPADNVWNRRVDDLPVTRNSATLIRSIGLDAGVHADFGSGLWDGGPIGIPFAVVGGGERKVPVRFDYADESDRGPYPLPANAPIEGGRNAGGDRHVLVVDKTACKLYELFDAHPLDAGRSWHAGSGAAWDLRSNRLRPATWTSADAAGLPILPGLARYDEVAAGAILHALRFTAPRTRTAYVWPARHQAGTSNDPSLPPMGLRVRLKRRVSLRGLPRQARIVATAMKRYGLLLADNGSPWYVSGAPDARWSNDQLHGLGRLRGSDFEVVDARGLR
ncbi:MAG TPA: hypothetical protein VFF79_03640 [Conexibacter sp.]|jgi:hypothetical protein|nr:hypothetical protein [Conexibacter sp.]